MHPTTKSSTSPLSAWLEPHPRLDGVALIDHLFNRLDGLYPQRWRSAFPTKHAIANWRQAWAEGFAEDGLTMAEIKRGLDECRRTLDWPPSFAEFVKACRHPPDYEALFLEAVEQMRRRESDTDVWSSPAVYWAASRIGWELRSYPYATVKSRWVSEIDRAIADVRAGTLPTIIPKRLDALPAPDQVATMPAAEAKAKIAAIRDAIAMKMACKQRIGGQHAL